MWAWTYSQGGRGEILNTVNRMTQQKRMMNSEKKNTVLQVKQRKICNALKIDLCRVMSIASWFEYR